CAGSAAPDRYRRRSRVSAAVGLLQRVGRLPPVGPVVDLDGDDPLHPPEAAAVGRDQASRVAMAGVQLPAAKARRQKEPPRFFEGEAAVVAGARDNADAAALASLEQAVEAHAAPVLGGVEAAGAVERRGD